jgi:phospholipid/cholesterol/gamma-HCH transport system substrate-binding protein
MTIRKEAKVGALGLLGIVILYFGFTFLKGSDFLSTTNTYNAVFEDVMGLEVSNPVTYNGVNVGRVYKLIPDYKNDKVIVQLVINEDVKLTDNSQVILADDGLIGGKLMKLNIKEGKSLEDGGTIPTIIEIGLVDIMQKKMDPTLKNIDSLTINLTKIVKDFDQTGQALKVLLSSATKSTDNVNSLLANNSKNIGIITTNAATLTHNLNSLTKDLDAQLKPILSKTGSFTDSLSQVKLGSTVGNLNKTISELQTIISEVNSGKGTLGKLAGDDSLYVNLEKTTASLNLLLSDMKVNPRRYVHFSLFGRKDKSKK